MQLALTLDFSLIVTALCLCLLDHVRTDKWIMLVWSETLTYSMGLRYFIKKDTLTKQTQVKTETLGSLILVLAVIVFSNGVS